MDTEVMRSELMRFSKEELVTELLAALVELASRPAPVRADEHAENGGSNHRTLAVMGKERSRTRK
jgi:hypothetical protein